MAGMAAIWAARVGSMDGTDWAWVMAAIEKRATARVYRIAFVNIGSILRVGRQLRRSRQFGRQLTKARFRGLTALSLLFVLHFIHERATHTTQAHSARNLFIGHRVSYRPCPSRRMTLPWTPACAISGQTFLPPPHSLCRLPAYSFGRLSPWPRCA